MEKIVHDVLKLQEAEGGVKPCNLPFKTFLVVKIVTTYFFMFDDYDERIIFFVHWPEGFFV